MWWVIIWVLLVVVSGGYLSWRAWGLWGKTKELGSELFAAQRRLDEVQGQLQVLSERIGSPEELAIFAGPVTARIKRNRAKSDSRRARHLRRATSLPGWAKHVD
jgi:hypothetical protein